MLKTREYTLCSPFRANAHNSSYIFCNHINEIPIIHQQHYDSFPSVLIRLAVQVIGSGLVSMGISLDSLRVISSLAHLQYRW